MMMRRRNAGATSVEVLRDEWISEDNAETFVTQMLDNNLEMPENIRHQINRLQRSLRGLPPVLAGEHPSSNAYAMTSAGSKGSAADVEVPDLDAGVDSSKKISKEERKRRKKERRKLEKKTKREKKDGNAEDEDDENDDEDDGN